MEELKDEIMVSFLRRGLALAYQMSEYPDCKDLIEEEYNGKYYSVQVWNDPRINKGVPHVIVMREDSQPMVGTFHRWNYYLKEDLIT